MNFADPTQALRLRRQRAGLGMGASAGFTLLEMIIVLALMIILAGMAALSFTSLEEGKGVEVYGNKLARMAKRASRDAVIQGRPIVIGFEKKGFGFVNETAPGNDGYCSLPKDVKTGYQRWNGGKKWTTADGVVWTFFPSGICDALRFRFQASDGAMEMGFNPLTGSVVDQAVYLNP
ncbi:MAG: Prepilin-type N-terminal cleavage/methylation protein [Verrucomicrobiaceae bacterium]|nr:Prepilin-type N-terminal cleavage/methylation protein [Verrucomicrobiaceae bacterium]